MADQTLHRQNIVACIWDFDKTLSNGYMESPLFRRFEIGEPVFWEEVNALPALYKNQGIRVSPDTVYLNHILPYARRRYFPGLNNALLRQLGSELSFSRVCPPSSRSSRKSFARNRNLHDTTSCWSTI